MNYFISPEAKIGNNVSIANGAYISDLVSISNDVVIGANVTFVGSDTQNLNNDLIIISDGVRIGAGSIIYPGVTVGKNAVINPGSTVVESVPPNVQLAGNPAKIIAFLPQRPESLPPLTSGKIEGVVEKNYKNIVDLRGNLTVIEFNNLLPFVPKRMFYISKVPNEKIRGEHAHINCHQLLVMGSGSCTVNLDDGKKQQICNLTNIGDSIYIPPMVWAAQYNFTKDALLLVLASDHYDEEDYIRNYEDFYFRKKI